jgi:N4-gp56 family major capsid protein
MITWLRSLVWTLRFALEGFTYQRMAGAVDVVELNVTTVTELDQAIPELWDSKLRADAERMTFWGPTFEGAEGSGKPIIRRDDFTKSPGDTIHIQVFRPLARTGVTGNTTLSGTEEQLSLGQFDLTADWVRHAVAFNKRATRRAVFDAAKVADRALSKWLAKNIDDDMFERLLITETAQATLYGGNVASTSALGASNVFTPDEIDRCKLQLMSLGALPFDVTMDNGQERPMYGIVVSEVSEYQLKSNSTWNQAQRDAGIRGDKSKLWTGSLGMYNGVIIYVLPTIQASHKKWGSYLRPEARLNGSHSDSVTTITVGGSDTSVDYTEYFPQSGTNYVLIEDEVVSFTGNTNSTLTGATRPATSSGTTAASHADGKLVTLASLTVERERAICFGSEMAVRTWAVLPTNQNELQDYRFKFGIGIEAAYGQKAVVDANSNIPNYVVLNVAAPRP